MPGIKKLSPKQHQVLVDKINRSFAVGSKVRVIQDDGTVAIWTIRAPASIVSRDAVIWCEEHRSCYMAQRVELVRTCRACGCCDMDCSQCIEATGQPCFWVASNLCSRCMADQEAAAGS